MNDTPSRIPMTPFKVGGPRPVDPPRRKPADVVALVAAVVIVVTLMACFVIICAALTIALARKLL